MLAQIVAGLYNTGFKTPEKPVSPLEFMPSQQAKRAIQKANKPRRIRMTKKRRLAIFWGLRATLGVVAKQESNGG